MFQRFMLDGHQCILEDPTRLHYEPYELKVFRNLECEWPLFFAFQIINHIYAGELDKAEECRAQLEECLIEEVLPNGFRAKYTPLPFIIIIYLFF